MSKTVNILSLGAGVQSSTLCFLYQTKKLAPMPDFAVFADTQREPPAVYEHLFYLKKEIKQFPIYIASAGDLGQALGHMPWFTLSDRGKGMLRRQCTADYKIRVVMTEIRRQLGYKHKQWMRHQLNIILGISTDEAQRMKEPKEKYLTNVYPLIDENWSRIDCLNYLKSMGFKIPPKSACYFCPYTNDRRWAEMKAQEPDLFETACKFDDALRDPRTKAKYEFNKLKDPCFVHSSRKPLREVEFKLTLDPREGMVNECEGMCGV